MLIYESVLPSKLAIKAKEFYNIPSREHLGLYQEIAVSRALLFESIESLKQLDSNDDVSLKSKLLARQLVEQRIDFVRSMCVSAATIESKSKDTYTLASLNLLVVQLVQSVRHLAEEFMDDERDVDSFVVGLENHIDSMVSLPKESEMTEVQISADDEAYLMDSTIPTSPDNSNSTKEAEVDRGNGKA